MHEIGLAAADAIDNDHLRTQIHDMLGLDAVTAGDLTDAREHSALAAALHTSMLDYEGSAYSLSGLAGFAFAQDRATAAARLIGASSHARQIVGIAIWPGMQPVTQAQTDAVTAALGPAAFATAAAEGGRLSLTDALEYGQAATAITPVADPFSVWTSRLRPPADE